MLPHKAKESGSPIFTGAVACPGLNGKDLYVDLEPNPVSLGLTPASGKTPGLEGPYGVLETEPRLATCTTSPLLAIQSLWPLSVKDFQLCGTSMSTELPRGGPAPAWP